MLSNRIYLRYTASFLEEDKKAFQDLVSVNVPLTITAAQIALYLCQIQKENFSTNFYFRQVTS